MEGPIPRFTDTDHFEESCEVQVINPDPLTNDDLKYNDGLEYVINYLLYYIDSHENVFLEIPTTLQNDVIRKPMNQVYKIWNERKPTV